MHWLKMPNRRPTLREYSSYSESTGDARFARAARWSTVVLIPFMLLGARAPANAQEKQKPITEVGGHTLDYWIKQIPAKDQSKSENALNMILLFGQERASQAVPTILTTLRKHNPDQR